jgi:hypothetical protein
MEGKIQTPEEARIEVAMKIRRGEVNIDLNAEPAPWLLKLLASTEIDLRTLKAIDQEESTI